MSRAELFQPIEHSLIVLRLKIHGCSYFPEFIPRFNGVIFLVVGDVPVDSETSVMTSSISRFADPTQFFGGAHRDRVCVHAFIAVSVRSCL
jgi:hypothetical protein